MQKQHYHYCLGSWLVVGWVAGDGLVTRSRTSHRCCAVTNKINPMSSQYVCHLEDGSIRLLHLLARRPIHVKKRSQQVSANAPTPDAPARSKHLARRHLDMMWFMFSITSHYVMWFVGISINLKHICTSKLGYGMSLDRESTAGLKGFGHRQPETNQTNSQT